MSVKNTSDKIVTAIIPAAGSGTRLRTVSDKPKQLLTLQGKPILVHTLEKFQQCEDVHEIIISARKADMDYIWGRMIHPYKLTKVREIVSGGANRQESVWAGMNACSRQTEIVTVHDAARIFVTSEIISDSIRTARKYGGCVVGIPATDTVKKVHKDLIDATVDRSVLWYAQTPQTFQFQLLQEAFRRALNKNFVGTDEAMLMEEAGYTVRMIRGSKLNFKITTPEDFHLANILFPDSDTGEAV